MTRSGLEENWKKSYYDLSFKNNNRHFKGSDLLDFFKEERSFAFVVVFVVVGEKGIRRKFERRKKKKNKKVEPLRFEGIITVEWIMEHKSSSSSNRWRMHKHISCRASLRRIVRFNFFSLICFYCSLKLHFDCSWKFLLDGACKVYRINGSTSIAHPSMAL